MSDERASRPIVVARGETKRGFWIAVTTSDWRVVRAIERVVHGAGLPVIERGAALQRPEGEASDEPDEAQQTDGAAAQGEGSAPVADEQRPERPGQEGVPGAGEAASPDAPGQ